MKMLEKHHSENRRFHIFRFFYGILFLTLVLFLANLQFVESDNFATKERIQGQRRILRPGARGDITDREGRILVGNTAQFQAIIHLDALKDEIWKEKIKLKKNAFETRRYLKDVPNLTLVKLLQLCKNNEHIKLRPIALSGKIKFNSKNRVKVHLPNQRLAVEQNDQGDWLCEFSIDDISEKTIIQFINISDQINVNVSGLFNTIYYLHPNGVLLPYPHHVLVNFDQQESFISELFSFTDPEIKKPKFITNNYSLSWEARFSIVNKYLNKINKITGRNDHLSLNKLKLHWNKRLVLPMELVPNLSPIEYARLIEGLPPDSAVQIQAKSVRHYPEKELASHVLGYVGSGYEADTKGLFGNDLATFEIKGKKGKAGIEKFFDAHLRGIDGGDIWRINPMGLRFDRIEKKASQKGKSIELTIDIDIQKVAELSLSAMSKRVAAHRILPDSNWKKTITNRTRQVLISTNENELSQELLLSAFKDAPFPLSGEEASTVAGFKGTQKDAEKLLRLLYSKGVLERSNPSNNSYILAPPPPPPGAAVLLDVKSGEILALASKPNYDLQNLSPRISQDSYDKIERMEAWLPRAWHPGYCPASPFKLVTAVAALRAKVVTPSELFICDGIYKGMICHCYPGRHGEMNLKNAEAQSCNVYFYQLAERLGEARLIQEAKSFGMDETPTIELPSLRNSPNVPDPDWKKKSIGEKWALEDTFNVAIGQGGLRQSPLQMACFAAALANKHKTFQPTLIRSNKSKRHAEPIGLSEQDLAAIVDGMHLATTKGTAKRCRIPGVEIAGKTGTAQWRNHNMKLSLAWFIGFAPIKNPEVAIAVLIEGIIPQDHIQGGLTATPVAKDILQSYFNKQKQKNSRIN